MTSELTTVTIGQHSDNDLYQYKTDFFSDFSNFKITDETNFRYRAVSITQFKELIDSINGSKNQENLTVLDVFSAGGKWVINTIALVNSSDEVTHIITGGKPRDNMIRTHVESAILTKRNDFKIYSTLDTLLREFYSVINRHKLVLNFDLRDQFLAGNRVKVEF